MNSEQKPKLYVSDCTNLKDFKTGGKRFAELHEAEEPLLIGIIRQTVESFKTTTDNHNNTVTILKGTAQMKCEDQTFLTSSQFSGNDDVVGQIPEIVVELIEKKCPDKLAYELKIFLKPSKQSPTGYSFDYRTTTSVAPVDLFDNDNFVTGLSYGVDAIEDETGKQAIEEKPKKTPKAK